MAVKSNSHQAVFGRRITEAASRCGVSQVLCPSVPNGRASTTWNFRPTFLSLTGWNKHLWLGAKITWDAEILNKMETRASLVIPNHNGVRLLDACLESIVKNSDSLGLELIIVDNGSHDDSLAVAEKFRQAFGSFLVIRNDKNIGVTRALNQGIEKTRGKYVAILNNDTIVRENWLEELIQVMELDASIGAAQCKLLTMNDTSRIDSAGCIVDRHGCPAERGTLYGSNELDVGQYDKIEEVFSAGCPASIFRRNVLVQAGMYDSEFFTGCEDLDLSWRIRLMGYKVVCVPKSTVLHRRSSTILRSELSHNTWFHFKKNGLATLMKNYELRNLVKEMPLALSVHVMHGLKDLFVKKDPLLFAISMKALAWNVRQLRYLFSQRSLVQGRLRTIDDGLIRIQMEKNCLLITRLLKPYLVFRRKGIVPVQ
jgi:GT2 family glycosyltransferase